MRKCGLLFWRCGDSLVPLVGIWQRRFVVQAVTSDQTCWLTSPFNFVEKSWNQAFSLDRERVLETQTQLFVCISQPLRLA